MPFVGIYSAYASSRLVAAIEIASPGNKDRAKAVNAFVEKILFLLHDGVHVMVVDVIGLPRRSLRYSVLEQMGLDATPDGGDQLWLASYCALPALAPRAELEVKEWAKPA